MQTDKVHLSQLLAKTGLYPSKAYWNLSPKSLVEKTIESGQGRLNDTGALCVNTGEFTGRSPKDRYIVSDFETDKLIHWGDINIPVTLKVFDNLYRKMCVYLEGREIWVRDCLVCADPRYQLSIRVINETPWANLFCHHLFIRPEEIASTTPRSKWLMLQAPGFKAGPEDGTRRGNFTIINFSDRIILIGGTAYTGELKKAVFSVLNFLLPTRHGVLPMHCSANQGTDGSVSLFFGLSGTGKTTLSTDARRRLIGDDEHGWGVGTVFNFEGGCYAKIISLNRKREPLIYHAVRENALLENTGFRKGTIEVDYDDASVTENTRAAYPIDYIPGAVIPSIGTEPTNVFFLTCDALGILPPIARLDTNQAMYHYLSGYTSKIAGTEMGIIQPQPVFSACFGAVFLPLHPVEYANLLGQKLNGNPGIRVWLVNTGWSGGPYGTGKRLPLAYTREVIRAASSGELEQSRFETEPVFSLKIPVNISTIPAQILFPRTTWSDKAAYDSKAQELTHLFKQNFNNYEGMARPEILAGGPG